MRPGPRASIISAPQCRARWRAQARVELPFLGARTKKASEPLAAVPAAGEEIAMALEYKVEMKEAVEAMFTEARRPPASARALPPSPPPSPGAPERASPSAQAYAAESQQEELGGGTELDCYITIGKKGLREFCDGFVNLYTAT